MQLSMADTSKPQMVRSRPRCLKTNKDISIKGSESLTASLVTCTCVWPLPPAVPEPSVIPNHTHHQYM